MSHERNRERERERENILYNNNNLISLQVNEFNLHRSASLNNKFKAKEGHAKGKITNWLNKNTTRHIHKFIHLFLLHFCFLFFGSFCSCLSSFWFFWLLLVLLVTSAPDSASTVFIFHNFIFTFSLLLGSTTKTWMKLTWNSFPFIHRKWSDWRI